MKTVLRIGQATQFLYVSTTSIRRWDKADKIQCFRTPGGYRRIELVEVKRINLGQAIQSKAVLSAVYARVSSHEQKQKGDLQRQIDAAQQHCRSLGFKPAPVFKDIGSGLNTKRRGFLKLCRQIESRKINHVVLTYPDRLTRFGFRYLEHYFASHGAIVEVINQSTDSSLEQDLVQDLISIITSFYGQVHELRSARARKQRQMQKSLVKS